MEYKTTVISERRRNEICEAAKHCFLKKGFQSTTMEDVIKETGMSKGGVYRYYKSTIDMLYDIMERGNEYRFDLVGEFVKKNPDMTKEELAIELVLEKMFAQNEYKSIYAMFLMECGKNEKLKELNCRLQKKMLDEFLEFAQRSGLDILKCFANDDFLQLMYAMFIADEFMDIRDLFLNKSDLFRDIISNYLKKQKAGDSAD